MPNGPSASILHYLRRVTNPVAGGDIPDAELLSRFSRHRDETAFATLMRRHGPMVLAICRRVVRDGHTAEDAFQATFLVLARKAGSLAKPELLANWLYGVAHRTAAKAKLETAKRRVHERQAVRPPPSDPVEEFEWHDLRTVLDEEVNRLPTRYRVPVVLCYLQGQTNAEAARRLGCSRGTIATLLARAREKLRRRLTQRGVGLSVGFGLSSLTAMARGGTVPLALVQETVKAAVFIAAGQMQAAGALAAPAVALAKGVSQGMQMQTLKISATIVMLTALIGAGAGAAVYRAGTGEPEVADTKPASVPPSSHKAEAARKPLTAAVEQPKKDDLKLAARTENFIVTAPTMEIARQVGELAEQNRKALARIWLDKELPGWPEPCPVRVIVTDKTTNSVSTFQFQEGTVPSKEGLALRMMQTTVVRGGMVLEGSLDKILTDLLPHEMTHTILAEWRGRPIPRWADEGAAMLSESAISRAHHEQSMEKLLRTGKPLPLTELLPNLHFPKDVMNFYAQSFSLTEFLVAEGGRRSLLWFIVRGEDEGWDKAVSLVYGYKTLQEMEQDWLKHARKRLAHKQNAERSYPRQETQTVPKGRQPKNQTALQIQDLLPAGPAPVQALATLDEENLLTIMRKVSYFEPETMPIFRKDGPTVYATSYKERHSYRGNKYALGTVPVQDAKGRKVDVEELRKRLKKDAVTFVLVSSDGRPVDPLHLRLYKEDTLIFVLPPDAQAAPPIRAPQAVPAVPAPVAPPPLVPAPSSEAPPQQKDDPGASAPPSGS